ncbi:unnamed protein product [Vitrella brassicaformis CCMP3155]|uniref:Uncharacterized protein n=1 Tax=Vitrella brassicaformis (strain CCMP3155) TaxID=1169540 RepID=A0A0G4EUB3_VITBC|nr:unnamed protein product [Vitrella brassicaformis CCMP3155]|eukprot:CEM01680.1 unnamed protein product [Vitrella brassicaformis CCMP3155]
MGPRIYGKLVIWDTLGRVPFIRGPLYVVGHGADEGVILVMTPPVEAQEQPAAGEDGDGDATDTAQEGLGLVATSRCPHSTGHRRKRAVG